MVSYKSVVAAIKAVCAKINLNYVSEEDGRLLSALKEKEYLNLLIKGLEKHYSDIKIITAKKRGWFDIRIQGIPINLKITAGGTDNAFNKSAIIYSISGEEPKKKNMKYHRHLHTLTKKCPTQILAVEHCVPHNMSPENTCCGILFASFETMRAHTATPGF